MWGQERVGIGRLITYASRQLPAMMFQGFEVFIDVKAVQENGGGQLSFL
jgi:hypothetical protein